jgi:hypothetical protein
MRQEVVGEIVPKPSCHVQHSQRYKCRTQCNMSGPGDAPQAGRGNGFRQGVMRSIRAGGHSFTPLEMLRTNAES